jgi:cytochrome P450
MVQNPRNAFIYTTKRATGPVVRIAPKTVIINDPYTIRRVLATSSGYARGPWFDSLRTNPHTSNVVSERDPRKHKQRRQLLAGGLSGKDIPGAERIMDTHVQNWMQMLDQQLRSSQNGEVRVNLSRTLPFLSMDIITHLSLSEPFDNVKTDTDRYRLIESLSTAMVVQQYQASLPELNAFVHWLGSLPILRDIVFPSVNSPGGLGELMQVRIMSCRVQAHNAHLTPGHSAKDPGEDSCHKR